MTKDKKAGPDKAGVMPVDLQGDESRADAMARALILPYLRHGIVADTILGKMCGKLPGEPADFNYAMKLKDKADGMASGDAHAIGAILASQALTLDAAYTELMRRAAINFGDHPLATERYARLAFKAQANSRATLEALAKLVQPREHTVRHVHVNDGGQALVADHFHHHAGGTPNAKMDEQPHATRPTGQSDPMPSPHPSGQALPMSGDTGPQAMPHARGQRQRRA